MKILLIVLEGGGFHMKELYFEELETVESLDAKDLGTVFGVGFLVGIIAYVGYAALT